MNKNTLMFVVLSLVIIILGMQLQNIFFPLPEEPPQPAPLPTPQSTAPSSGALQTEPADNESQSAPNRLSVSAIGISAAQTDVEARLIEAETNKFMITFSTQGGVIKSLKLKEHKESENQGLVDMIFSPNDKGAFNLYFGNANRAPVSAIFDYHSYTNGVHEFEQTFFTATGESFVLKKTYTFKPNDYLFELKISLNGNSNIPIPLNIDNVAYTLEFGPQIGPVFESLDGTYALRKYKIFSNGSVEDFMPNIGESRDIEGGQSLSWVALTGKYFSLAAIPDGTKYQISLAAKEVDGLAQGNYIHLGRPVFGNTSSESNTFRFYAGPKNSGNLSLYNTADSNDFGLSDLKLDNLSESTFLLGWLEWIIVQLLTGIYIVVPNYGLAIIVMAIVIKLALTPFTRKSYQSTSKMQKLNPKIAEVREKYKKDPQRMNAEIASLFKKEGVNPMGGCLPLLFQLPILISVFQVFRNYFDFRGAPFFGWISDLSSPEAIFTFESFSIPLLGDSIRLLPIIYVGTQILYSRTMRFSGGSATQMRMMNTVMPIFMFFVVYNFPSGLVLYWIASNLLVAGQQLLISKKNKSNPSS